MKASSTRFRPLSQTERDILGRLLERDFPGREEIRRQLEQCLVRIIDEEGSLEFKVESKVSAPVARRVPVEAEMRDEDGIPVRLLLHVVDNVVAELDVYKADGSPLIKELTPSALRLVNPDEDIWLGDSAGSESP